MTASIRTQLIDNLCAKLVDGDLVKAVERSMYRTVQAENLPVCAVFPVTEETEHSDHDGGGGLHRTLNLRIVYVVGVASDPTENVALDQNIDPALVWLEQKVTEDATLGGLGFHTHVRRITWQIESGEEGFIGAIVDCEIEYYTLDDPSVTN